MSRVPGARSSPRTLRTTTRCFRLWGFCVHKLDPYVLPCLAQIYQSYFSNTGCTGSASGTSALPGNSSCVRSSNSFGAYVQNLVFSATIPTALATSSGTPVFPYTKMTYYYNGCSTLSTAVPSVMAFYALGQASDSSVFCGPQTSCPGPTAAGATQSGTITTCPTPAGTIANTGFAQTNSYNAPPCTAANVNNDNPLQAFKLGVCDPQVTILWATLTAKASMFKPMTIASSYCRHPRGPDPRGVPNGLMPTPVALQRCSFFRDSAARIAAHHRWGACSTTLPAGDFRRFPVHHQSIFFLISLFVAITAALRPGPLLKTATVCSRS